MFLRFFILAIGVFGMFPCPTARPRIEAAAVCVASVGAAIALEPLVNSAKRQFLRKDFFKTIFTADSDTQKIALQILVGIFISGCGLHRMYTTRQQGQVITQIVEPYNECIRHDSTEVITQTERPSTVVALLKQAPESFKAGSLEICWPKRLKIEDFNEITDRCMGWLFKIRPKCARTLLKLIKNNKLTPEYMRTGKEHSFLFAKKTDGNRYLYIVNNSKKKSGEQENAYDFMVKRAQESLKIVLDGGRRRGKEDIENTLRTAALRLNPKDDDRRDIRPFPKTRRVNSNTSERDCQSAC